MSCSALPDRVRGAGRIVGDQIGARVELDRCRSSPPARARGRASGTATPATRHVFAVSDPVVATKRLTRSAPRVARRRAPRLRRRRAPWSQCRDELTESVVARVPPRSTQSTDRAGIVHCGARRRLVASSPRAHRTRARDGASRAAERNRARVRAKRRRSDVEAQVRRLLTRRCSAGASATERRPSARPVATRMNAYAPSSPSAGTVPVQSCLREIASGRARARPACRRSYTGACAERGADVLAVHATCRTRAPRRRRRGCRRSRPARLRPTRRRRTAAAGRRRPCVTSAHSSASSAGGRPARSSTSRWVTSGDPEPVEAARGDVGHRADDVAGDVADASSRRTGSACPTAPG